jgi:hypothetical protein
MKWLVLLGVIGAAAPVVWYVATGRPHGRPRSRPLAEFAWAVLTCVLLAAAVWTAHRMGIFSVPLVALAFVPFGIAVRGFLVATRDSRRRRELDGQTAAAGPFARLTLPLMVVMVVAIAVFGVLVGWLVGPH